jgi:hypothetical protein
MRYFGCGAAVVRAFRAVLDVVDHGAVAMLQTGYTLPAPDGHSPLIALPADKTRLPRLAPTQLVEPLVINPEMMRDLMDHRYRHLVDHVGLAVAEIQQGFAVDRDGVRQ